jgi:hypothetical protein
MKRIMLMATRVSALSASVPRLLITRGYAELDTRFTNALLSHGRPMPTTSSSLCTQYRYLLRTSSSTSSPTKRIMSSVEIRHCWMCLQAESRRVLVPCARLGWNGRR